MLVPALFLAVSISAQAPTWPPVDTALPGVGGGENDAAVVVGITQYYDLPAIAGAADNAAAWQQYFLQVRRVPGARVVTLRDREGTRERILASAKTMATQVPAGGRLWFIFVGHGAPAPSGKDGLLLGADTQPDPESLSARGVPQELLLETLAAGRQSETLAIFDACFSGKAADGNAPLVKGLQATIPTRRDIRSKKLTVLASSDTFAGPLPGTERPAFSFLLLGALRGWGDDDGDHTVGVQEAFSFTRDTMQAVLGTADRLPSQRGASSLTVPVLVERPELSALVAGRCPAGQGWDGARCGAASSSSCPAGTAWNGDVCASVTVECPTGTSWNGRACAAGSASAARTIAGMWSFDYDHPTAGLIKTVMRLDVDGSNVTGTYGSGGKIRGTLQGNTFTGFYDNNGIGRLRFTFDDALQNYTGSWGPSEPIFQARGTRLD